jgi:hypothetical protein
MTKGVLILVACVVGLFLVGCKSGFDRDVLTPMLIFIFGSSLGLGYMFGLGAAHFKTHIHMFF